MIQSWRSYPHRSGWRGCWTRDRPLTRPLPETWRSRTRRAAVLVSVKQNTQGHEDPDDSFSMSSGAALAPPSPWPPCSSGRRTPPPCSSTCCPPSGSDCGFERAPFPVPVVNKECQEGSSQSAEISYVHRIPVHYHSKVWGHPDNFMFSLKTHTFTAFSFADIIAQGFSDHQLGFLLSRNIMSPFRWLYQCIDIFPRSAQRPF